MSRRKNEDNNPFEPNSDDSPRQKKRVRKRRIWPFVLLLGLLLFVFFLPTIIVSTSLKDRAIAYALGDFDGRVTVHSASLGWFSPIQIEGVELRHQTDVPLISIANIKSSKPLIKFLTGTDYGEFEIREPVFNMTLDENGSNIERAVNALIATQSRQVDDSAPLPALTIKCINGSANIHSLPTQERWNLDSLNLVVKTATENIPLSSEGECRFVSEGNPSGQLAFSAQVDNGAKQLSFTSVQLAISSQNLPLALAAPIAQRFVGPTTTAGYMTCEMQLAYDANATQFAISVDQLELTKAGIAAPELIGSDRLFTETLIARGKINLSPRQISANEFEVDSDIGKFNAHGVFDADQLNNLVASGELLNTPFSMSGKIDLVRIANMIPHTLQLYDDLRFQSGIISFQASSTQQDESQPRRIVLNIDSANVHARRGGQDIVWQKPVRLVGTINQSNGKLAFEDMRVVSDFLTIQGQGSFVGGNLEMEGDLTKLVDRIGQFADLGALQLAGKIQGHFAWKLIERAATENSSIANQPVQLEGQFDVSNAVINWPGLAPWQTGQLSVKLLGTGQSNHNQLMIENGNIDILVGTEQLVVTLSQPVTDFWSQESWILQCQLTGDLARWLGHAKNCVDIGDIKGSGHIGLTCNAQVDSSLLRLDQAQFRIKKFGFEGYGLMMDQPEVEGKTNLRYDLHSGQFVLNDFSAAGRSLSLSSKELKVLPTDQMLLDGTLLFQADVNRVAVWYGFSVRPTDVQWYGTAEGSVTFDFAAKGIGGNAEVRISDLIAAQQVTEVGQSTPTRLAGQKKVWNELWRESSIEAVSGFLVGKDYDSIRLQDLKINASSLRLAGQGTINQITGAMITDFKGNWNPKWKAINSVLQASIGKLAVFRGNQPQPITIKGPIFAPEGTQNGYWISPQLQVQTAIGWNAAEIMKLPLGTNRVSVDLNQSVAAMEVGAIAVGKGALRLTPQLDLRSETIWLALPPGTIAEQVELTPDACRRWLKFVAPLVADATSAQGQFSVSTNGVRMPVLDPMAVEAQGLIRLSKVTIGAGPLAQELLVSANQIRSILKPTSAPLAGDSSAWLQMGQQDVPFAIQNGRVFHDGLTIAYKDVQIRTKGSVGIDQTINMVAEIPILDSWIEGESWLAGLKGQSISIPIAGTLSAPRLDQRAIKQLSQQLIRKAAGSALNKVVEDKIGAGQRVINDRLNQEIDRANEKITDKLQKDVGEKLENEMLKGLNNLFKKGGGN